MRTERCHYCQTEYQVVDGAAVTTFRTGDPPPPARFTVDVLGTRVHACTRGVPDAQEPRP